MHAHELVALPAALVGKAAATTPASPAPLSVAALHSAVASVVPGSHSNPYLEEAELHTDSQERLHYLGRALEVRERESGRWRRWRRERKEGGGASPERLKSRKARAPFFSILACRGGGPHPAPEPAKRGEVTCKPVPGGGWGECGAGEGGGVAVAANLFCDLDATRATRRGPPLSPRSQPLPFFSVHPPFQGRRRRVRPAHPGSLPRARRRRRCRPPRRLPALLLLHPARPHRRPGQPRPGDHAG